MAGDTVTKAAIPHPAKRLRNPASNQSRFGVVKADFCN